MTERTKEEIRRWRKFHRFMAKVKKQRDGSGCWLWKGNAVVDKYGFYPYGKVWFTINGRRIAKQAHRVLWEMQYGPLGPNVMVNKCGKTLCVNPEHWTLASHWTAAGSSKND
jgi:hypothetical protein